jgi:hypothetical protein
MKFSWSFSFSIRESYQQKIGGDIKFKIKCEKMLTEYLLYLTIYLYFEIFQSIQTIKQEV